VDITKAELLKSKLYHIERIRHLEEKRDELWKKAMDMHGSHLAKYKIEDIPVLHPYKKRCDGYDETIRVWEMDLRILNDMIAELEQTK
jgi:hypothetical protein